MAVLQGLIIKNFMHSYRLRHRRCGFNPVVLQGRLKDSRNVASRFLINYNYPFRLRGDRKGGQGVWKITIFDKKRNHADSPVKDQ